MRFIHTQVKLWFDVGKKRYTTHALRHDACGRLWFDVGKKRYTTLLSQRNQRERCGLM